MEVPVYRVMGLTDVRLLEIREEKKKDQQIHKSFPAKPICSLSTISSTKS